MAVLFSASAGLELPDDGLRETIIRAIETALAHAGLATAEVSLSIVDDARIQALNREYRAQDRPTDVLSFPLLAPDELAAPANRPGGREGNEPPLLLGDVVISLPRAQAQAEAYGHSLARELGFLAVHGTLHLLGYDHDTPEEEARMEAETEAVLGMVGLGRVEGRWGP